MISIQLKKDMPMPAILPKLTEGDKQCYGYQEWYRVSITDFQNGHREACIAPHRTLSDLPPWWGKPSREDGDREPDKEESQRRAARRAKSLVRKQCKAAGVDSLFTLTYQACMTDRAQALKHYKEFVRRVRRVIPDFFCVATLEKQARGALHFHLATHRLPMFFKQKGVKVKSWNLMRAIWRSIVGELGGNFDESKDRRGRAIKAGQVARYISKYVSKALDDGGVRDEHQHRYFKSGEAKVPRPVVMLFRREQLAELIGLVVSEVGADGVLTMFYSRDRDLFWTENFSPGASYAAS